MGILYRIKTADGKESHLFGTVQSDDEAILTLPFQVKTAFDNASCCVFESFELSDPQSIQKIITEYGINWDLDKIDFANEQLKTEYINSATVQLKSLYPHESNFAISKRVNNTFPLEIYFRAINQHAPSKNTATLSNQLLEASTNHNKLTICVGPTEELVLATYGLNFNPIEQIEIYNFLLSTDSPDQVPSLLKTFYLRDNLNILNDYAKLIKTQADQDVVSQYFSNILDETQTTILKGIVRLNSDSTFIAVSATYVENIAKNLSEQGYLVEPIGLTQRTYPIAGSLDDGKKVDAFRRIYRALADGQTGYFKRKKFLPIDGTVSINQIMDYVDKHPKSRSDEAWRLAQLHYDNISRSNKELIGSIHSYAYAKSTFFKHTTNQIRGKNNIQAPAKSRTDRIYEALEAPLSI